MTPKVGDRIKLEGTVREIDDPQYTCRYGVKFEGTDKLSWLSGVTLDGATILPRPLAVGDVVVGHDGRLPGRIAAIEDDEVAVRWRSGGMTVVALSDLTLSDQSEPGAK